MGDILDQLLGAVPPVIPAASETQSDSSSHAAHPSTTIVKPTWPLQRDAVHYYGNPASRGWLHGNTVEVECPWELHMGSTKIQNILIHKKCADSLRRVLRNIWEAVGHSQEHIQKLHYDVYDGSYNFRPMRGGSALSMHSFAAAIDWDAAENEQHSRHHLFHSNSLLVVKFKEENWIWGGDWGGSSIDSMHVQAARVR